MQLSIVSNSTLKMHELLEFMQVMIEEMQEQEAEFLKEQKEKKLKNRRLSAFLETFHSMFNLPKFERCCSINVVHEFSG